MPRRTDASQAKERDKLLPLKRHRVATGKTLEEFARRLGVTKSAVSKWEMGTRFPRPRQLKKLAMALGVSTLELTKMIEPEAPAKHHPGASAA